MVDYYLVATRLGAQAEAAPTHEAALPRISSMEVISLYRKTLVGIETPKERQHAEGGREGGRRADLGDGKVANDGDLDVVRTELRHDAAFHAV